MSAIDQLLREPAAQAIGWALLHFVWQGTLVAALTALVLAALRKSAADIRYVVAAIGLSLMLTLPAVTAVQSWSAAGGNDFRLKAEATGKAEATSSSFEPVASGSSSDRVASGFSRKDDIHLKADGHSTDLTSVPSSSRLFDSVRIEPWLPMLVFPGT